MQTTKVGSYSLELKWRH